MSLNTSVNSNLKKSVAEGNERNTVSGTLSFRTYDSLLSFAI